MLYNTVKLSFQEKQGEDKASSNPEVTKRLLHLPLIPNSIGNRASTILRDGRMLVVSSGVATLFDSNGEKLSECKAAQDPSDNSLLLETSLNTISIFPAQGSNYEVFTINDKNIQSTTKPYPVLPEGSRPLAVCSDYSGYILSQSTNYYATLALIYCGKEVFDAPGPSSSKKYYIAKECSGAWYLGNNKIIYRDANAKLWICSFDAKTKQKKATLLQAEELYAYPIPYFYGVGEGHFFAVVQSDSEDLTSMSIMFDIERNKVSHKFKFPNTMMPYDLHYNSPSFAVSPCGSYFAFQGYSPDEMVTKTVSLWKINLKNPEDIIEYPLASPFTALHFSDANTLTGIQPVSLQPSTTEEIFSSPEWVSKKTDEVLRGFCFSRPLIALIITYLDLSSIPDNISVLFLLVDFCQVSDKKGVVYLDSDQPCLKDNPSSKKLFDDRLFAMCKAGGKILINKALTEQKPGKILSNKVRTKQKPGEVVLISEFMEEQKLGDSVPLSPEMLMTTLLRSWFIEQTKIYFVQNESTDQVDLKNLEIEHLWDFTTALFSEMHQSAPRVVQPNTAIWNRFFKPADNDTLATKQARLACPVTKDDDGSIRPIHPYLITFLAPLHKP